MRLTQGFMVGVALCGAAGCGLVFNYGDYTYGTGGAGGSTSSTSTGNGGTGGETTSATSSTTSSTSATTSSVTSSTSTGGGCNTSFTCTPGAPSGWSGPIALLMAGGTTKLDCGSAEPDWPNTDGNLQGGTTISAPLGCTACSCTAPGGGTCTTSNLVTVNGYSGNTCNNAVGAVQASASICEPMPSGSVSMTGKKTPAIGGSCAPSGVSVSSAASVTSPVTACTGGIAGTCPGGVCAKPAARICIYRQGMQDCSGTGYSHMIVSYGDVDDQRTCTACSCGMPSGSQCTPTVGGFSDANCTSAIGNGVAADGSACLMPGGPIGYTKVLDPGMASGGFCVPSGGVAGGHADGKDPTTICCNN